MVGVHVRCEPSDGEAVEADDPYEGRDPDSTTLDELADAAFGPLPDEIVSLTGVPEGVGPKVKPDCPLCTGGRGEPCAWH